MNIKSWKLNHDTGIFSQEIWFENVKLRLLNGRRIVQVSGNYCTSFLVSLYLEPFY